MSETTQPEWMHGFQPTPWEGRWKPGQSGNPAGKPKGALSRSDKIARALNDDGLDVVKKVIEAAKAGDLTACGLILSRIHPALRSQSATVQFEFDPELPIAKQTEQVLAAIAAGEVPPDVGKMIIDSIAALGNLRATEELAERLAILEAKVVNP